MTRLLAGVGAGAEEITTRARPADSAATGRHQYVKVNARLDNCVCGLLEDVGYGVVPAWAWL